MRSISCLVVALLLAASGLTASGQGAKGSAKHTDDKDDRAKNVNVVNTPNVNVANTPNVNVATLPPVTGSVSVTNAPTVNVGNTATVNVANTPTVTVGNTPNVNVANTPSVTVSNASTAPVPTRRTDDPGRIPYQQLQHLTCVSTNCNFALDFGSVPAEHRVVIQHVSAFAEVPSPPSAPVLVVVQTAAQGPHSAFVSLAGQGFPSGIGPEICAIDQAVQAYFDAGEHIAVNVNNVNSMTVVLAGYELDCTAGPCAPIAP